MGDTLPNPKLKKTIKTTTTSGGDGGEKEVYAPAWELLEESQERLGREVGAKKQEEELGLK